MIKKLDQLTLPSNHNNKLIAYDVHLPKEERPHPVIIFCHGFKGFKDWGHFNLLAAGFADAGFTTFKMNFSHNGTTPDHPIDFVDLEAFGNNNFSIELDDLDTLISHITGGGDHTYSKYIDPSQVFLIGHSKGGSTCLIKACEDPRVRGLVTWAAVANIIHRYSEDELGEWAEKGVKYIYNGRTDQQMPLYYQLAQDVYANKKRFDIPSIVQDLNKPLLVVHGDADESVDVSEGELIDTNCPNSTLKIIPGGDHTFGGSHPWKEPGLPALSKAVSDETIMFLKQISS